MERLFEMCLRCVSATNQKASSANWKASSENWKIFSKETEGFFRRALSLYTHKFPKRSTASLTYLQHSQLGLLHSLLGLPHLRLSRNSGPAMISGDARTNRQTWKTLSNLRTSQLHAKCTVCC